MRRRARAAVTAAYAAQGLGYAVVVTSLPALKERQHIDDTIVSLIVLGVCVAAAGGSFLANAVAVRAGSRAALVVGLACQALALPLIAVPLPPVVFLAAFALYGIGLGAVDAASAMQGVMLQRAHGSPLLGGFFAGYTAAAIVGALLVAGATALLPLAVAAGAALGLAAVWAATVAVLGARLFAPDAPALADEGRSGERLPTRGIWTFGFVILAVFVLDSAVSTWSTVYLHDTLAVAAWVAPLGYGAYQVAVLATRLATDRLLRVTGPRTVVVAAVVIAVVGCVGVAALPWAAAAIAGFALAGVATGALVPVAFGAAGDLAPARSDQVIARVNVFNYVGAVIGAVAVGLLADGPGLGIAFLIPAALVAAVLSVARAFRPRTAHAAAR
ncbi:MFS transporter [Microbacterium sp. RD1]|uniref:MFS transporter n=1 Tax=Microbacterium sp. RD1 TaxID=3457313 RepID=UPI003FA523F6